MEDENFRSEKYWMEQEIIPGSTRVPIDELKEALENGGEKKRTILDLGSGEGRSTQALIRNFPNSNVVAFDLSMEGLKKTKEAGGRVRGTALELPFKNESADVVVLCGVLTNITDDDPKEAVKARKKVFSEVARVLKSGGICVISDFSNEHSNSGYHVNYFRHELVTGEHGTIAVFDLSAKITFAGKSDNEVASLAKSPHLQRFAHHYSPEEIIDLVEAEGNLINPHSKIEAGSTPSGTPIDALVMTFTKK